MLFNYKLIYLYNFCKHDQYCDSVSENIDFSLKRLTKIKSLMVIFLPYYLPVQAHIKKSIAKQICLKYLCNRIACRRCKVSIIIYLKPKLLLPTH